MIAHSKIHMRIRLACITLLLSFFATQSSALTQDCSTNCLSVYSIALTNAGTYVNGIVKLTDETGAGAGARGTVVHVVWTRADGSAFDQYANIGTRLRAQFRLYTAGATGTYTLTVVDATKAGYTFDPQSSNTLSESISVGTDRNQAPVAISNADVTSGSIPLTVKFDSYGSNDRDGAIVTFAWNFGDGNNSTEANPVHTYTAVGNYTATLLVTDNMGATAKSKSTIMATDSNAGCSINCISVDKITMKFKRKSNVVKSRVSLLDENENRVKGAVVHVVWVRPDGSMIDQYRTTGKRSRVAFSLIADTMGKYILTVVEVSKDGQTFDPDNSNMLSGVIEIKP